jgi:hypothetical protein
MILLNLEQMNKEQMNDEVIIIPSSFHYSDFLMVVLPRVFTSSHTEQRS